MQPTINLKSRLISLIEVLPNISNQRTREALIIYANLDDQLVNQLDLSGSAAVFAARLIETLIKYGPMHDARDPIDAILNASGTMVGADLSAEIEKLLQDWRRVGKQQRHYDVLSLQVRRSRQRYLGMLRDKVAYLPLSYIAPNQNGRDVPLEEIYVSLPTNLTMGIKVDEYHITDWWIGSDFANEKSKASVKLRKTELGEYQHDVPEKIVATIQSKIDAKGSEIADEEKERPLILAPFWENRILEDYIQLDSMHVSCMVPKLVIIGDPGTGKSTFAKYLTLCLINAQLDPPVSGPTIDHFGMWSSGHLTPVLIELRRFFNWSKLREATIPINADMIWDFVCEEYLGDNEGFQQYLYEELLEGRAIFIFDGLDEISLGVDKNEQNRRRRQIVELVRAVTFTFRKGRIIFTSRPYGYSGLEQEFQREGFVAINLIPLNEKQIYELARKFYLANNMGINATAYAKTLTQELKRVNDFLKDRPLFLTLMANLLLTDITRSLPERAGLLFKESIDLLLYRWVKARSGEQNPDYVNTETNHLLRVLESIAYNAHFSVDTAHLEDPANIKVGDIVQELMDDFPNRLLDVVNYLTQQAGILKQSGPKSYRFHHRTFEEFLAASKLARDDDFTRVREHIQSKPQLWREAFLLLGDVLDERQLWRLLNSLSFYSISSDSIPDHWYSIWLAGKIVENRKLHGASDPDKKYILDQLVSRVTLLLDTANAMPAQERVDCGKVLGFIGDSRPGVGINQADNLPDILWCRLPAGKFQMGTTDEMLNKITRETWASGWTNFSRETPAFDYLVHPFEISRYPVTVGQFKAFINASDGYFNKIWWLPLGWDLHTKAGFGPYENDQDPPNLPKYNVSWFEANAFCRWLGDKKNAIIRLPTEVEWEWAARGTTDNIFPWGDEYNPDYANVVETNIQSPSPVGCFYPIHGVWGVNTPFELCGNVWEWCSTICEKEGDFVYGYPYRPDDGREDLELGDEYLRVVRGGSYTNVPVLARNTFRGRDRPFYRRPRQGFRIVREVDLTKGYKDVLGVSV